MRQYKVLWFSGSIMGFLAVAFGAFGAHAPEERIPDEMLIIFETGARYHLVHALAILASAYASAQHGKRGTIAGWLFVAGVLIFSGSLYALALTGIKMLGAVTPLGGFCLLSGWVTLSLAALPLRDRS